MTTEQINQELERLEQMPDEEFRRMSAWFEKQTRERIRQRQRAGAATRDDLAWLFENAA